MNIDRLIAYTRDPSNIGQDDTEDLEQLLADYPYFTAAQHLLALKYRKQNSSRYNRQAQRAASQAPDQLRLAFLLEEPLAQWAQQLTAWTNEGLNAPQQPAPSDEVISEVTSLEELSRNETVEALTDGFNEPQVADQPLVEELAIELPEEIVLESAKIEHEFETSAKEEEVETPSNNDELLEVATPGTEEVLRVMDEGTEISDSEATIEEVAEVRDSSLSQEDLGIETTTVEVPMDEVPLSSVPVEMEAEVEEKNEAALENEIEIIEKPEIEEESMPVVAESEPELTIEEEVSSRGEATHEEEGQELENVLVASAEVTEDVPAITTEKIDNTDNFSQFRGQDESIETEKLSPVGEQEFLSGRHERRMWFRFFAGKPWREQPEDVLEEMYMQHMAGDFLQAKSADFEEIKEELKAVINHEPEVKRDVAMEAEIRRLAWESVSDEELPASETLAKIYEEQKDYKKALRIYQKLMLKFPDRMTYFAALVENAKSKLNH
jgi:tetratricopeptide (TPR) repeat protein